MSKVLQSQAHGSQLSTSIDPTCLLWGFLPGQLKFLSQMLGISGIHFLTHPPTSAANLRTVIGPATADLSWSRPTLPVIRVTFSGSPLPESKGNFALPPTSSQTPSIFWLPSQVGAFLDQVDQYCYPPRGRILNIFGLGTKSGASTIAFGLANNAKNSVFVDATCPPQDQNLSPYAPGMRKLGFTAITNFSSCDLETDLLASRLREILPSVQNTRFLQLHRTNPNHISRIFSLLMRAFSLVVVDWGPVSSPQVFKYLPGQTLVVSDFTQSPSNRQLISQLRHQGIPIVINRVPNKLFLGSTRNWEFLVPYCRELKRLQNQGLGAYLPKHFQARLAHILRSLLTDQS